MKREHVVLFVHSLESDWNHGNAHFLRGIISELQALGHRVTVYEPEFGWSRCSLIEAEGEGALDAFHEAYPTLQSQQYDPAGLDLDRALDEATLVLVHEWNDPAFIQRIGRHRVRSRHYQLLFHDTHHRMVSEPNIMAAIDLSGFDAVLAFGQVLRDRYVANGWGARAFVWHEAADVRRFMPQPDVRPRHDLVWIGNWGDDERSLELHEFLLSPIRALRLDAVIHGVRYPEVALQSLRRAGARYAGWLANACVPSVFAGARLTVHIPRRHYVESLPGIPTIRVFEALACGVPLVCTPWEDSEGLFTPGCDYAVARTGRDMVRQLAHLLFDREAASAMAEHGRRTILARHTCAHRVHELLDLVARLR